MALLVSSASSAPLFEEWTTSSSYEHNATEHRILIIHREFTDAASAQERFAAIDRLMPAVLGEYAYRVDLPDEVGGSCEMYTGSHAAFGEEPREAWAVECLSGSDTYLVIVDESPTVAIELARSIVETGEPVVPEEYQLVNWPHDYPGSRTSRGVRLAEDRPVFQKVNLKLVDEDGHLLEIRVEEESGFSSMYVLGNYDPEDVDFGNGVSFKSENQDPVRVCRQFVYETAHGLLFRAVCSHGLWNLYVTGSDEDAVRFVAVAFSEEGTEDYVPEGYVATD